MTVTIVLWVSVVSPSSSFQDCRISGLLVPMNLVTRDQLHGLRMCQSYGRLRMCWRCYLWMHRRLTVFPSDLAAHTPSGPLSASWVLHQEVCRCKGTNVTAYSLHPGTIVTQVRSSPVVPCSARQHQVGVSCLALTAHSQAQLSTCSNMHLAS